MDQSGKPRQQGSQWAAIEIKYAGKKASCGACLVTQRISVSMEQQDEVARLQQYGSAIALRDQRLAIVQMHEAGRSGREGHLGNGAKLAVEGDIATKTN